LIDSFAFLSPLLGGGLATTYDVNLRLMESAYIVDFFLSVLIKLFFARCYG